MITVISGTNRPNSKTKVVAKYYQQLLQNQSQQDVEFFSLEDIPSSILHNQMYEAEKQDESLNNIQNKYIIPSDKWVFVLPEYNGSFPGIMKLFIDAISVVDYKKSFANKKLALLGISSGRSGNLRGLDHMTNSMNYLGTKVFYNKLPISKINDLTNDHTVTDDQTKETLSNHAKDFLAY